MSRNRRTVLALALTVVVVLACRGVLSIVHDGLSPDWLWP